MQTIEYQEGYQAYLDGESSTLNPYTDNPDKWDDWSSGYYDAWEDEATKNY